MDRDRHQYHEEMTTARQSHLGKKSKRQCLPRPSALPRQNGFLINGGEMWERVHIREVRRTRQYF